MDRPFARTNFLAPGTPTQPKIRGTKSDITMMSQNSVEKSGRPMEMPNTTDGVSCGETRSSVPNTFLAPRTTAPPKRHDAMSKVPISTENVDSSVFSCFGEFQNTSDLASFEAPDLGRALDPYNTFDA